MKYYLILLAALLTTTVSAQDQKTQITNVARKLITNTTNIELTEANSRVSPQIEQQVRHIADSLSAVYPLAETMTQNESEHNAFSQASLSSKLKNNLLTGGSIFLAFLIVHFALKKYDEKKNGGKSNNITDINHAMRNAPYLISVILPSQTEAETLARHLIAQHLIARADILSQQQITHPTNTKGVLLIAQTVKGRLKKVQTHLKTYALTPLPIPILRGHKDHLQWIVNTADGKT
ncbi:MAG: hypothetical protein ACI8V2_002061 [Candidatus Latescibacterota bacterium]|jgi:uncharacterized protein involved in tolerance to divalent cations